MKKFMYLFAFIVMVSIVSCEKIDADIDETQQVKEVPTQATDKDDSTNPGGGGQGQGDTNGEE